MSKSPLGFCSETCISMGVMELIWLRDPFLGPEMMAVIEQTRFAIFLSQFQHPGLLRVGDGMEICRGLR